MTVDLRLNILIIALLLLSDYLVVSQSSQLLFDFLIGAKSKRQAKNIKRSQSFLKQFIKSYIYRYLKHSQDKKDFKKYHILYIVEMASIFPQYSLSVMCFIFNDVGMFLALCGLLMVKFLLFVIFRNPSWPRSMGAPSKYAYKPGNRKKQ